jgi:hypothetical protein
MPLSPRSSSSAPVRLTDRVVMQHTLIVAAYVVVPSGGSQSGERSEGSGLLVEASDPSENVVFAKTTELVGRFAFTTTGECFACPLLVC